MRSAILEVKGVAELVLTGGRRMSSRGRIDTRRAVSGHVVLSGCLA